MDISTVFTSVATVLGMADQASDLLLKLKSVVFKGASDGKEKNEPLKDNVTVIIDFSTTTIEESVKRYLKAKNIDSTIITCTNPRGFVHMDVNDSDVWRNAVQEIYTFINTIVKAAPKRINIFISAPATLAFALGYTLRPHCTPHVYQFNQRRDGTADSDLYSMVLHVNDSLKG